MRKKTNRFENFEYQLAGLKVSIAIKWQLLLTPWNYLNLLETSSFFLAAIVKFFE